MSHRRKETTMNKNKEFEHEIDPELLEEIRLWEEADHDELTEYYFSCSDPYLSPYRPTAHGTTATSTRTAISA